LKSDCGQMQAAPRDILVEVRREWNDDATAIYHLDAISRWHWIFAGHMRGRKTPHFLYGYVICTEAISGGVSHSCKHGPPPHNIKVCILDRGNEGVWDKIIHCAGPRPQPGSVAEEIRRANRTRRFRDRDLSGVTINKLISAGIDAPERLLSLSPEEIGQLERPLASRTRPVGVSR
jgi:hypothetical protein